MREAVGRDAMREGGHAGIVRTSWNGKRETSIHLDEHRPSRSLREAAEGGGSMKYLLGVSVTVALAAACGGSTSNGASTGDAGTGGGQEAGPVPSDDGGSGEAAVTPPPPDDGPWPADHYPIALFESLGGTVLAAPKLVTVTFVGDANRDALRTFDDSFAEGTLWWSAVSAGYGIGAVTSGGHVELPDTVSNTTLDDDQGQIQQDLASWVTSNALPAPDANTVYVLFFPASTTITFQGGTSCNSFGGYHSAAAFSNGTIVSTYVVVPDCSAAAPGQAMQLFTDTVSHEVIEAATDPHPGQPAWYGYNNAWFRTFGSTIGQGEVADVCQRAGGWTDASGNVLARSWVNAAAKASHDPCQPAQPGEIFYSLAVPTVTQPSNTAGVPDSDGYVVVKRGESKTIDAVFFSDAKLPNDAQLTVGVRSHGTLSASIGTGITASLTPTAAHNGMHVSLTIQVDSSAAAKDYNLTARSTLSTTDYHDWPFILRVE
jgi:hypothetical protein